MIGKSRYVAVKFGSVDAKELRDVVNIHLLKFYGKSGRDDIRPRLIECNVDIAIFRCNRHALKKFLAALPLIREYKGKQIKLVSLKVSGTLRCLRSRIWAS